MQCKMFFKIFVVIVLQITTILAAPIQTSLLQQLQEAIHKSQLQQPLQETIQQQKFLQLKMSHQQLPLQEAGLEQLPLLEPPYGTIQQQQLALQEQMFALQQFQALQRMNLVPTPMTMNSPPILILFPNNEPDVRRADFNSNSLKYPNTEELGDEDSEVIDAEPIEDTRPFRAVLLMPNSRSIIGDLISSIPFLPIEINVPDTISWIYNSIAGIISGIGQRLPFRPQAPNTETQNPGLIKSNWNRMKTQNMPIVVIPLQMSNKHRMS